MHAVSPAMAQPLYIKNLEKTHQHRPSFVFLFSTVFGDNSYPYASKAFAHRPSPCMPKKQASINTHQVLAVS